MEYTYVSHTIKPVYDERSRVLLLGSFPSPASRRAGFFYGNPRNRFWRVIAEVRDSPVPETTAEKTRFLLENRIALWDVIASCDIRGASDGSIKNAVPNDIGVILDAADIKAVFTTGRAAYKYYLRFLLPSTGREAFYLPSPSAANAQTNVSDLIDSYGIINRYL